MLTKSMEKHSILTKGCVLLCLILLSFCPTPTDALPTHLSRRGDDVWGESDTTAPITGFGGGISRWVIDFLGTAAAGTPGVGASQLDSNSVQGEQALPGADLSEMTRMKVPESQPPEDDSFYGIPKPVQSPTSDVKLPESQPPGDASFYGIPKPVNNPTSDVKLPPGNEQPDLGPAWVPKSKVQGQ